MLCYKTLPSNIKLAHFIDNPVEILFTYKSVNPKEGVIHYK